MLDVVKGQLCFIIGTVYMDMPLKPNVLDDIARDHSISALPPREKFYSTDDSVTLEDESGRICLVGECVNTAQLVTGVIIGALGIETNNGDFEVVDICSAGMAPQPRITWEDGEDEDKMDVDETPNNRSDSEQWVALLSGLEIGATSPADAQIQMLVEYLTGEAGGSYDQSSASRISRLIIAGNSLASVVSANGGVIEEVERKPRRYGHDTTHFSPHPTLTLSAHLLDIARAMPIHILPGPSDPSGTIIPQQPFPRAMFRGASAFSSFSCETNPTYIHLGVPSSSEPSKSDSAKGKQKASASTSKQSPHRTFLVSSGQTLDDMFKYLPTPPATRLSIAESTLRWRHIAPTAPDTLWCHPYFSADPFVIEQTPDVYVVGNQPEFRTKIVEERGWGPRRGTGKGKGEWDERVDEGEEGGEAGKKRCRVVLLPGFRETGLLVLVNMRTLAVRTVQFAVEGMNAGGPET
ncbi:hypothetical protein AcW1_005592 [Taiwanofungus camphoratus]|nr:hypothetical protein AcV5_005918 [Antrodia cinnamomea]KAI0948309.1 hypothetical protein AcV7_009097 [Antrodia cinnamomea]KAI0957093.1 hypothetical protein AcW1_005592 [Antrodia cinnamomea]